MCHCSSSSSPRQLKENGHEHFVWMSNLYDNNMQVSLIKMELNSHTVAGYDVIGKCNLDFLAVVKPQ